jgi:uncharacterized protein YheU (UPF0270 family)
MAIVVTKLSDKDLDNLIENHRRKGVIDTPQYAEALDERANHHDFLRSQQQAVFEWAESHDGAIDG